MIRMRVDEAAALLAAERAGGDAEFAGVKTDSRTIEGGELFAALRGEHVDGHDYVEHARRGGAAAALVERQNDCALPALRVDDVRRALGCLAQHWRRRFELPLVAITGSNGKTTVKEMVAAILRQEGRVLASRGNLNNEIGLPLSLFELAEGHRAAVVEMGANHPREIAWLAAIAEPTVGVVTQCGPAHLEGFGSVEGVARAKGELLEHLPPGGVAVINADDRYADLWRELAGEHRCLAFGLESAAELTATWHAHAEGTTLRLDTPAGSIETRLGLPGRHNVLNALAAAAAALAVGASPGSIAAGLEQVRAVAGRLELKSGPRGVRVLDDTYNANPLSVTAGLEVLSQYDAPRWLVLGDMAELGEDASHLHEETGQRARAYGVERVFASGELSRRAVWAFGEGGRHFDDVETLIEALRAELTPGITVLVKGSRSMRMERVVAALERGAQACS